MITVEVEKEINQENKVMLGLNIRQIICVGFIVLFSLFIALVLKLDLEIAMYPCIAFGAICFAFGWYKPDGIPFEKVLLKKIQVALYGSNIRRYKTKNQYVTMLNDEYNRRRNIDLSDKKLAKQMKRADKKKQKAIQRAKKTAVCKPVA